MAEQVVQIRSAPGIKRDGTKLEGDNYVDGQWVRFQRGLPRKIGGYRSINKYLGGLTRSIHEYTQDSLTYLHMGSANLVERLYIDGSFNTSVITDRTPTSGFTAAANNLWQFDVAYDAAAGNQLVAQVAPNLGCICNSVGGEVFTGDLLGTGALVAVPAVNKPANFNATGGIVVLPPYTVVFGSDGYVAWSAPGAPNDFVGTGAGNAYVTGQKIVRAMPLRGGPGNSPSGLFWSADALVRASYVGGTEVFQFDTISTQTSILSAASVIEYDGIFYWIASDRFLMFNGVVRELENNLNLNFFFDNVNMRYRQKVFALKVPRYGEIWWCFPKGNSPEPNHAIIYNVRENTWYDTALPEGGRGAAVFSAVFTRPIMTGVASNPYKLWVHEVGTDAITGQSVQPIQSYFETADISFPVTTQVNKATQVLMVEPDFVQRGEMTLQVRGRANARAPEVNGPIMSISETPATPQEQVVFLKTQRRELRFRFESNCLGGDYQMGTVLAHIQPGDGTVLG